MNFANPLGGVGFSLSTVDLPTIRDLESCDLEIFPTTRFWRVSSVTKGESGRTI